LSNHLTTIYGQFSALQSNPLSSVSGSNKVYAAASSNISSTYLPQLKILLSTLNQLPTDKIMETEKMGFFLTHLQDTMMKTTNDLKNVTDSYNPPLDAKTVLNIATQYNSILGELKAAIVPESF